MQVLINNSFTAYLIRLYTTQIYPVLGLKRGHLCLLRPLLLLMPQTAKRLPKVIPLTGVSSPERRYGLRVIGGGGLAGLTASGATAALAQAEGATVTITGRDRGKFSYAVQTLGAVKTASKDAPGEISRLIFDFIA